MRFTVSGPERPPTDTDRPDPEFKPVDPDLEQPETEEQDQTDKAG